MHGLGVTESSGCPRVRARLARLDWQHDAYCTSSGDHKLKFNADRVGLTGSLQPSAGFAALLWTAQRLFITGCNCDVVPRLRGGFGNAGPGATCDPVNNRQDGDQNLLVPATTNGKFVFTAKEPGTFSWACPVRCSRACASMLELTHLWHVLCCQFEGCPALLEVQELVHQKAEKALIG